MFYIYVFLYFLKLPLFKASSRIIYFCSFICLFIFGCLGLCSEWIFSSCSARASIAVASLVAEHGLQGIWALVVAPQGSVVAIPRLQSTGSIVMAHRLSRPEACRIFLDQGSNPCLLHWQVDCLPWNHQGSPSWYYYYVLFHYSCCGTIPVYFSRLYLKCF